MAVMKMIRKMEALQRRAARYQARRQPPQAVEVLSLEQYYALRFPKYSLARHILALLEFMVSLKAGDLAVINLPPRHGKTEIVRAFIEWWMGKNPSEEVITTSYSASLAYRTSRRIRNEIAYGTAFKAAYPNIKLARDSKAIQQWNLEHDGGLRAAGVGGSITGMGATLAVLDDPIKGRKQAESAKVRASTLDWLKSDFITRLSPQAIVILIQTRWHTNDPAGWILEEAAKDQDDSDLGNLGSMNVRPFILPALALEHDPLGRTEGEALWEERWSRIKLLSNKNILGDYDFNALYQQSPVTRGGAVFQGEPPRYTSPDLNDARVLIYVDTASSKATSADYTAILVLAVRGKYTEETADILEVIRRRMSITELEPVLKEVRARYGNATVAFEKTSQSYPIIQYIESRGMLVRKDIPDGDKFTRAVPAAAAWNRGVIRVPAAAPWLGDFLNEIRAFTGTGDEHDDQVDAFSGAWKLLTRRNTTETGYA